MDVAGYNDVSATVLATFKNKPNDQPRLDPSKLRELAKMTVSGGRDTPTADTMQAVVDMRSIALKKIVTGREGTVRIYP